MSEEIFVALLRAINIGGRNKIDMKRLKRTFESVGLESVVTYINSGNVVFVSRHRPQAEIAPLLEKAVLSDFGLKIKILVRRFSDFEPLIQALPKRWKNDDKMKVDVLFLWDEIDKPSIKKQLVIRPTIDLVKYVPGCIVWKVTRKEARQSGLLKLATTDLYQQITIRNINTTRKIYSIMKDI